ncbi:hypothetical protein NDU88_003635 [Pleurodeles waltl]|uniref:Uncharacterized protein n=1 Tax=Pleurodeles waltl TaxID=8319 RepID=A0AAV7T5U0_PLEWA|nr:hypothetical protein NDU88_003635 [Pleurodeles waltl]
MRSPRDCLLPHPVSCWGAGGWHCREALPETPLERCRPVSVPRWWCRAVDGRTRDILLSGSPGDSNATVKLNAKQRRIQQRKGRKKRIVGIGAIPDAAPKLTIPDIWASKEVTSPRSPALTIISAVPSLNLATK